MIENYLVDPKTQKNKEDVSWCNYDLMQVVGFNRNREKENYFFNEKIFKKESEIIQFPKNNDVEIDINGQKYLLPSELRHIAFEINKSKYILQLKDDWDSNDACRFDPIVWQAAIKFLLDYSKFILDEFNVVINTPEINPCPNGTIDLSWRTTFARFLINVKTIGSPVFASYYGDLYNNNQAIKNPLITNEVIKHLAYWMKNLSK